MSAAFKNAKKKLSQHDLRKLMNEQKGRMKKEVQRISSPLAKYPLQYNTILYNKFLLQLRPKQLSYGFYLLMNFSLMIVYIYRKWATYVYFVQINC